MVFDCENFTWRDQKAIPKAVDVEVVTSDGTNSVSIKVLEPTSIGIDEVSF
jgi:hypothetical protein